MCLKIIRIHLNHKKFKMCWLWDKNIINIFLLYLLTKV